MKKIIRLTERDLTNIVKRIINEREFSPNRIKYGKEMRGGMDSFRERRIPNSEFDEGDVVVMSDNGHSGTVLNVMFDHDDQKFYYEVRVTPERGNPYRREVSSDEIETNGGRMNENMGDVYSDSNEDINYDIKAMDCGEYSNDGHVDIDDDDTIVIRYCKGDEDKLDRLKRRGKKLLYSKYGM